MKTRILLSLICVGLLAYCAKVGVTTPPLIHVQAELFDQENTETLGLVRAQDTEIFTIFEPKETDYRYNNGVVLLPFKGKLYAQWQSSIKDEDGPETEVKFSVSDEGKNWSLPAILAPARDNAIVTSGGWWTDGETLIAYINVWPSFTYEDRSGYTEYIYSKDGVVWSTPQRVLDIDGVPVNGVIEQDPYTTRTGRIVTAFHTSPGLHVKPFYTDDPLGITGWTQGEFENLPTTKAVSREIEPSWFLRPNGDLVMVFRDQDSSYQTIVSVSENDGVSWTDPELAAFPDSRSKQSAGNLPNGDVFRVNNPRNTKIRSPLVVSLSKDGVVFDRAWLLRGGDDLQALRYEGKYKSIGYSYPKSVIWGDYLYVGYATNKEDVQISRVPWKNL